MLPNVRFRLPYTLAHYNFKNKLTNLNDLFWFSECQKITAKKFLHAHGKDDIITQILGVSNENSRRYPRRIEEYDSISKNHEKWIKSNLIVCLSACFEVYLKSILTLSFKFDPGILIGAQGHIDGFKLMCEENSTINKLIEISIEKATRGDWSSRVSEMRRILPTVADQFLPPIISELEFIRKYRNSISHAFDVDLEYMSYSASINSIPLRSVSIDRIKLILKNVIDLAKNIDSIVYRYELVIFEYLLYLQHEFSGKYISDAALLPTRQIELRKKVGFKLGHPILGKAATEEMLIFYKDFCYKQ